MPNFKKSRRGLQTSRGEQKPAQAPSRDDDDFEDDDDSSGSINLSEANESDLEFIDDDGCEDDGEYDDENDEGEEDYQDRRKILLGGDDKYERQQKGTQENNEYSEAEESLHAEDPEEAEDGDEDGDEDDGIECIPDPLVKITKYSKTVDRGTNGMKQVNVQQPHNSDDDFESPDKPTKRNQTIIPPKKLLKKDSKKKRHRDFAANEFFDMEAEESGDDIGSDEADDDSMNESDMSFLVDDPLTPEDQPALRRLNRSEDSPLKFSSIINQLRHGKRNPAASNAVAQKLAALRKQPQTDSSHQRPQQPTEPVRFPSHVHPAPARESAQPAAEERKPLRSLSLRRPPSNAADMQQNAEAGQNKSNGSANPGRGIGLLSRSLIQ